MPNQKPIRKLPFRPRPGQRKAAFNQSRGPTNAEAKKAWQQIGIAPSSDESQEIWGAIKGFLSTNFPETLEKRTLLPSKLSSMLRGFLDKEGPQFFSGTNPRYSATVPYTPLFDDAQLESHYQGLLFLIGRAHEIISQEKARPPRPGRNGIPIPRPSNDTSTSSMASSMANPVDLFVHSKKQLEVQFGVVSKDFTKLHPWDNLWNFKLLTKLDKLFVHGLFTFVENAYGITSGALDVADMGVFDAEDKGPLNNLPIPATFLSRSEPGAALQIQSFIFNTMGMWANAQGVLQLRVTPCSDEIVVTPSWGTVELTKKRTFDQMVDEDV